jgi:hypothetical protein
LWVNPVKLIEVDRIHCQSAQTHLNALAKILGTANRMPLAWARASQPTLGGDRDVVIRVESFTQQVLRDERAVRVRGVEQVDTELRGSP